MLNDNVNAAEVAEADPDRQYRREVRAKLKALVKERAATSRAARVARSACKGRDKMEDAKACGAAETRAKWDSRSAQLAYAFWKGVPSVVAEPTHRNASDIGYKSSLGTVAYYVRKAIIGVGVDAPAAERGTSIEAWLAAGR